MYTYCIFVCHNRRFTWLCISHFLQPEHETNVSQVAEGNKYRENICNNIKWKNVFYTRMQSKQKAIRWYGRRLYFCDCTILFFFCTALVYVSFLLTWFSRVLDLNGNGVLFWVISLLLIKIWARYVRKQRGVTCTKKRNL